MPHYHDDITVSIAKVWHFRNTYEMFINVLNFSTSEMSKVLFKQISDVYDVIEFVISLMQLSILLKNIARYSTFCIEIFFLSDDWISQILINYWLIKSRYYVNAH